MKCERREEELWQESERQAELVFAWFEHYRHMRRVHRSLAGEYDRKLQVLEDGG